MIVYAIIPFAIAGLIISSVFLYIGFKKIREREETFNFKELIVETNFKNSTGYQLVAEGLFGIILSIVLIYGCLFWFG